MDVGEAIWDGGMDVGETVLAGGMAIGKATTQQNGMGMGIAVGLGGMAMDISAGLNGMAMDIAIGLGGMAMGIAAGLRGVAMAKAVGLDLGVDIALDGILGQTRRITTGLANRSGSTGGDRRNGLTFIGIRTDQSGHGTGRGTHRVDVGLDARPIDDMVRPSL